ncbi:MULTISPECIES: hypothetical protein [Fischerella]|uniref:hypothetical protein n=1 Tax=Fischerella TaxID=1190 RepID=UPI0002FFDE5B|nr:MULTISPECIES: hypothetical protein [Fischerella]MBD2431880.1 hypothetical protein [Fischerella sp. FACHB-380]
MYRREEHRVCTHQQSTINNQQSTINNQQSTTILSTAKDHYPINLDLSILYMTLPDN